MAGKWPTIEGKRLTQQGVRMLVVDRDRARRDLRQEKARVAELEAEKLALDTCWNCKGTLEKVGSPESRVPRCTECLDEVD